MYNYDVEHNAFGLSDLVEDPHEMGHANGSASPRSAGKMGAYQERPHQKSVGR